MASKISKLLIEMKEHPESFVSDQYYLVHSPSNQHFWIRDGFGRYGMKKPREYSFAILDQFRFSFALSKYQKHNDWLARNLCKPVSK